MAIGPQILIENLKKEADSFESQIDDALKGHKILPGKELFITPPRGFNSTHLTMIKQRYLAVGWKDVSYQDSQHDGASLIFKS